LPRLAYQLLVRETIAYFNPKCGVISKNALYLAKDLHEPRHPFVGGIFEAYLPLHAVVAEAVERG
jgi:hypothetical protein